MNQSPRIKPTSINDKDENPKAVENRLAEEVDRWDPPRSVDLGCGGITSYTHKAVHGPHHQRWPSPQKRGIWRTAQFGMRRYDVLNIVPHRIFSM
jgi:hypothetical protein